MSDVAVSVESTRSARWYAAENTRDRAAKLTSVAQQLWNNQRGERDDMRRAWRLYGNFPYVGLGARLYKRSERGASRALSFNVTKSVIDTYTAMITKDRPKLTVQTIGADWETQQRAKAIEQFIDGINYEARVYDTAARFVLDSGIFGTGWAKCYANYDDEEKPRIAVERVFPWEVLMDPLEAVHGKPATRYQIAWHDKYELREEYPEFKSKLMAAGSGVFEDGGDRGGYADLIERVAVVEAWRLPRRGIPGRHSLACGDVLLVDEPWTRTFDPFEPLVRYDPIMGVTGDSLSLELEPIQTQINILLDKIRRSHHLLAAGYWLVEQGSDIISNQLTNQIGQILKYRGTRPQLEAPAVVAVEIYQHLDRLYQKAYELPGIPPLNAQGQKPAGLNSGRAQLVYADTTTQRFQPSYRKYQEWYWQLSRHYIALSREISESTPGWTLPAQTQRNIFSAVAWADANLDDSEFTVRLKPTNALADDPEGVLDNATTLVAQGMISPDEGLALLTQNEDWATFLEEKLASRNLAMKMGDAALNHGKFISPEPDMNLQDAVSRITALKLDAIERDAPQDRIDLLDRWLVRAKAMLKAAAPPPSPPATAAPPTAAPPGAPPHGPPMQVPKAA